MTRRLCVAAVLGALIVAPATSAARTLPPPHLDEKSAIAIFLAKDKVADWVGRYPKRSLVKEGTYDKAYGDWTVRVWSGRAGEVAFGRVDDLTGIVEEAWTGPQVAYPMARGHDGAFGGKAINSYPVWLGLCALFFVGLADLRRPLALRNLDLLVLLSLSVSLWFFNAGRIFTSVPLAYPVLLYLLGRAAWIGWRGRSPRPSRPVWPVWLLVGATVFVMGFRVGLDIANSNVIDVGYAGVIGAQRIASGQWPYGRFPQEVGTPCAPPDRDGRQTFRIQPNGRCESANAHGDTYGPVAYEAYLPGYLVLGWKGKGDRLNAARFTSILFDLACLIGLALVGWRYGGSRLAATLAFAWAAFPFTQYVASSNSNDAIQPALLIFAFWLASSAWARGGLFALAGWTKFGSLVLFPLWLTFPRLAPPRRAVAFVAAFLAASLAAFAILFLDGHPLGAASTFWHRTLANQLERDSPFSLWDWRQYHAGLPDLHVVQWVLAGALVVAAVLLAFRPRTKSPLQLAAFSAALLIGFEIVLTHWFYLYVAWFFPFLAFALFSERDPYESSWGREASENSRSSPVIR